MIGALCYLAALGLQRLRRRERLAGSSSSSSGTQQHARAGQDKLTTMGLQQGLPVAPVQATTHRCVLAALPIDGIVCGPLLSLATA